MFRKIQDRPNLILVGFMGTGKSAVGLALARRLRRRYLDTDNLVRRAAGESIARIFRTGGENVFREYESQAVARVSGLRGFVVSTGGGILVRPENLRRLRLSGALVCLSARPEVILARTAPWRGRPMLLTAPDPQRAVQLLLAERDPLYLQADWSIDTSELTVDEVVDQICSELPSLYAIAATRSSLAPDCSSE